MYINRRHSSNASFGQGEQVDKKATKMTQEGIQIK